MRLSAATSKPAAMRDLARPSAISCFVQNGACRDRHITPGLTGTRTAASYPELCYDVHLATRVVGAGDVNPFCQQEHKNLKEPSCE